MPSPAEIGHQEKEEDEVKERGYRGSQPLEQRSHPSPALPGQHARFQSQRAPDPAGQGQRKKTTLPRLY